MRQHAGVAPAKAAQGGTDRGGADVRAHDLAAPHATALHQRMKELAAARPRYGYRRIFTLLHREGWNDGIERVYRPGELLDKAARGRLPAVITADNGTERKIASRRRD